jgi:amino acid permease
MKKKGMPPLINMVAHFVSFFISSVFAGVEWYLLQHTSAFYKSGFIRELPILLWAFLYVGFYFSFAHEWKKWEKNKEEKERGQDN